MSVGAVSSPKPSTTPQPVDVAKPEPKEDPRPAGAASAEPEVDRYSTAAPPGKAFTDFTAETRPKDVTKAADPTWQNVNALPNTPGSELGQLTIRPAASSSPTEAAAQRVAEAHNNGGATAGSEQLKKELEAVDNVADRDAILRASQTTIDAIAAAAAKGSPNTAAKIIGNLSQASELAGTEGRALLAKSVATAFPDDSYQGYKLGQALSVAVGTGLGATLAAGVFRELTVQGKYESAAQVGSQVRTVITQLREEFQGYAALLGETLSGVAEATTEARDKGYAESQIKAGLAAVENHPDYQRWKNNYETAAQIFGSTLEGAAMFSNDADYLAGLAKKSDDGGVLRDITRHLGSESSISLNVGVEGLKESQAGLDQLVTALDREGQGAPSWLSARVLKQTQTAAEKTAIAATQGLAYAALRFADRGMVAAMPRVIDGYGKFLHKTAAALHVESTAIDKMIEHLHTVHKAETPEQAIAARAAFDKHLPNLKPSGALGVALRGTAFGLGLLNVAQKGRSVEGYLLAAQSAGDAMAFFGAVTGVSGLVKNGTIVSSVFNSVNYGIKTYGALKEGDYPRGAAFGAIAAGSALIVAALAVPTWPAWIGIVGAGLLAGGSTGAVVLGPEADALTKTFWTAANAHSPYSGSGSGGEGGGGGGTGSGGTGEGGTDGGGSNGGGGGGGGYLEP